MSVSPFALSVRLQALTLPISQTHGSSRNMHHFAHCSSACHLYYEIKYTTIDNAEERIYRVRNEWNFQKLCAAGRFGYDYENRAQKDEIAFNKALGAIKSAQSIKFNSFITNEEAKILQTIKEKTGINN